MKLKIKWKLTIISVLLAVGFSAGGWAGNLPKEAGSRLEVRILKIKEEMKPLETVQGDEYPASTKTYFDYYGLAFEDEIADAEHIFGTFVSGRDTLASHIYKPKKSKATVVLVHGYLNHTGQFKHLIGKLLRSGYAVAAYDLPGHGLSTGERASIDDFGEYSKVLIDFTEVVGRLTSGPYHVIGFSMGGGIVVDYLLVQKGTFFDKVVLAGPLIHNVAWKSSETGYKLYSNFADSVPRAIRRNSSDKEFLRFNKKGDVLHCQKVPLKWVKALHEWNDKVNDAAASDKPVRIIQGDKDTTVSYKYNLRFIKGKFTDTDVTMIKGGRHELFNESKQLRTEVMAGTIKYLEE